MVAVLTVLTVVTFLTVIIVLIVLTTLEHSDGRRNYIIPQKGIKEARKQQCSKQPRPKQNLLGNAY